MTLAELLDCQDPEVLASVERLVDQLNDPTREPGCGC